METDYKELLARERAARIHAEAAAQTRDEFLAVVSHELRAPLNGIQCWSHVIERQAKNSSNSVLLQRAVNGIKTGISQQVRLIEDLLDVTRILGGKLRLMMQPVTLLPLIRATVGGLQERAAVKNIRIVCDYGISDQQIEGDPNRIQQALWHLLINAIKFTPANGNVWLTASISARDVEIIVRDDGAGIDPDLLPHLFDRFGRQDTAGSPIHDGLGLGLFLAQSLAQLHGGSLHAASEGRGQGATFTLALPIRLP